MAIAYLVVKYGDRVSEVSIAGTGITFRGESSPAALPLEERKRLAEKIEERIESKVGRSPPPPTRVSDELTGKWFTPDDAVTWTITIENGFVVFRERYSVAPEAISAVGYGPFDGHTWTPQFQNVRGQVGTASLAFNADEDTLIGQVVISGVRFSLSLHR